MKLKIFNYSESTFSMKKFGAKGHGRVDVTYYARVRSKNAMLQNLLKLPHMRNATVNWIRERISQGAGGMEKIITDDSIYVANDYGKVIGKFTVENKWVPFDPPLKPHRPWLEKKDDTKKKLTDAFVLMQMADEKLEKAAKILAEFGMDVPDINLEAMKLIDATNSIEQSNQFIRSFIRMSVLQQVVKLKPKETSE